MEVSCFLRSQVRERKYERRDDRRVVVCFDFDHSKVKGEFQGFQTPGRRFCLMERQTF